nr:NADH dehydrogenase subunit 4L [Cupuladria biporosa]
MNNHLTSALTTLTMFSMISAFFTRKQLMITMLSLELILLMLFMLTMTMMWQLNMAVSITFYILVMGACEASISLSLLINMTRFKGNDKLNSMNMIKC